MKKINLRKARKIDNFLKTEVIDIGVDCERSYSVYDDQEKFTEIFSKQKFEILNEFELKLACTNLRYRIRQAIQQQNVLNVNHLLNTKEKTKALIKCYSTFIDHNYLKPNQMETVEVLKNKLKKLFETQGSENIYGRNTDKVDYYPLSKESLLTFEANVKKLKNELTRIDDDLIDINVKNVIDLSEEDVELLKRVGLEV